MKNYFDIFDLPVEFNIDLDVLDARYFELQRNAHPDMMGGNVVDSSQLNNGYKTLKNRFKRAQYLVELNGENELKASPELLMEMMELREENSQEKVAQVKAEVDALFKDFAKTESAEVFVRIKYLERFLEENKN